MRNHAIWLSITLITAVAVSLSYADQLNEAKKVAQEGYILFLKGPLNNANFRAAHGLSGYDNGDKVTLGEPLPLYSIFNEKVTGYTEGSPLENLYEKTDVIMFPVLFDGRAKLILKVSHYGTDQLQIGSLGESALAAQLDAIQKQYPSTNGFTVMVLSNNQTHSYLLHIPQLKNDNLTIIKAGNGYATLTTVAETMQMLKMQLQEMMNR